VERRWSFELLLLYSAPSRHSYHSISFELHASVVSSGKHSGQLLGRRAHELRCRLATLASPLTVRSSGLPSRRAHAAPSASFDPGAQGGQRRAAQKAATRRAVARHPLCCSLSLTPRRQIRLPKPQGHLPDPYSWNDLAAQQARAGGSDARTRVGAELAAAKSTTPAAPPSNRRLPQLPHLLLDVPNLSFFQLRPVLGSSCSRGGASLGAARGGRRGAARRAACGCLARVARLWSRHHCDWRASAWRRASPIRRGRASTGGGAPTRQIPVRRAGGARGGAPAPADPQPVLVLVDVVPPRRAHPLPCSGTGAPPTSSPPLALCPQWIWRDRRGERGMGVRDPSPRLGTTAWYSPVHGRRSSLEERDEAVC
jgi:hypothetical protein